MQITKCFNEGVCLEKHFNEVLINVEDGQIFTYGQRGGNNKYPLIKVKIV